MPKNHKNIILNKVAKIEKEINVKSETIITQTDTILFSDQDIIYLSLDSVNTRNPFTRITMYFQDRKDTSYHYVVEGSVYEDQFYVNKQQYGFMLNGISTLDQMSDKNEEKLWCFLDSINQWKRFHLYDTASNSLNFYKLKLNGYLKKEIYNLSFELLPKRTIYVKRSSNALIDSKEFVPLNTEIFSELRLVVLFDITTFNVKDRRRTIYDDSFFDAENHLIIDFLDKKILETGRNSWMHNEESRHFVKKRLYRFHNN